MTAKILVDIDQLWTELKPRILKLQSGEGVSAASVTVSLVSHNIAGPSHYGTLTSAQGPQFALLDGTRAFTGPVTFVGSQTFDGVDVSAHVADPDAHHARVTVGNTGLSLSGQQVSLNLAAVSGLALNGISGGVMLDDAIAGAGLAITGKVLEVGAGNGISVNANDVAVNQGYAFAWTNNHTWTSILSSNSFASGWAGNGWRIDNGVSEAGKTSVEFDNLTVRNRMRVYELLINQIRATNGSVLVSNTGKVASVSEIHDLLENGDSEILEDGSYDILEQSDVTTEDVHGFSANDIIRAQRFTGSQGTFKSDGLVVSVGSTTAFVFAPLTGTDAMGVGYEYVRLGNVTNTARQGGVYLTPDDSNAPFMDIFDGVTAFSGAAAFGAAGTLKARLGKLTGITDPIFGALSGYGLWTANGYFTGGFHAGPVTIDSDSLRLYDGATAKVTMNSYGIRMADGFTGLHFGEGLAIAYMSGAGATGISFTRTAGFSPNISMYSWYVTVKALNVGEATNALAGTLRLKEISTPAAPGTNEGEIYLDDNGSGKTRLMVRFQSGSAVQIAIEP